MAVYREGYSALEKIQKQTQAVFNDACDAGAPVFKDKDLWGLIQQLYEWYGEKGTKKKIDNDTHTFVFELIDEWAVSDRRKTEKEATEQYKLTYTKLKSCSKKPYLNGAFKGAHGFVYIEKL